MAVAPMYLSPWIPTESSYDLAFSIGATSYLATINVTPGREYWASADGDVREGEEDLVSILCQALYDVSSVTWTPSIDSQGRVVIDAGAVAVYALRWDLATSTLPPEPLGWYRSQFNNVAPTSLTAIFPPLGSWVPGRPWVLDTDDVPAFVAAHAPTAGGESKGYFLGESGRREHRYTLIPRELIIPRYAESASHDDRGEWRALHRAMRYWADGRRVRVYEDLGDRSSARVYRWIPGPMAELGASRAPRYNATLAWRPATTPFVARYAFDFASVGYMSLVLPSSIADDTFNSSPTFSWSFWARPDTLASSTILSRSSGSGSYGWAIEIDASGQLVVRIARTTTDDSTVWTSAASAVPLSEWTHFLVVFDGSLSGTNKLKIYADGVDITSAGSFAGTWDMTALTSFSPLGMTVADSVAGAGRYDGRLDEIAIWNRALIQSNVNEIYNGGVPVDLATLATTAQPLAWWRGERAVLSSIGTRHLYGAPTAYVEGAYQ